MLDPKTLERAAKPLRVSSNPYGMTVGAGHVWVTGLANNTLTRIDF
jgi:streptogramin lyase